MIKIICSLFLMSLSFLTFANNAVLVEAENFQNKGGWVVDQQFTHIMGSAYLMAHGLGKPVVNASTVVNFQNKGRYKVYVRTYNWTSPWSKKDGPGVFKLLIDGKEMATDLGNTGNSWMWQYAGEIDINEGNRVISLKDLTGFNGRCDAIYFTTDNYDIPTNDPDKLPLFRKVLLKLPVRPKNAGLFDLVVIGGGIAGTTTAITSARLGLKVALIQDRPVLGGNNSSEVRVHLGGRINLEPYPKLGIVVNEIAPLRGGNAKPGDFYEDEKKMEVVKAEENITLFMNYRAYEVEKDGTKITKVFAKNIETSEELEFSAPLFADCTGDGTIGFLAGAEYMIGREGKNDFNESSAPDKAEDMTMGSSVQWYSCNVEKKSIFPNFEYGIEFNEENAQKVTMGEWTWETGMNYDQIYEFERIRDYGLMVIFSNWSFLKNSSIDKKNYDSLELDWVAYIGGKRESRRLKGDLVLTEQDILNFVIYPDATVSTSWSIDLHYPDPINSKYFPGKEFKSIAVQKNIYQYPIPYRCFYSRNIDNLFMAGRNISVTHIVLGSTRVMRTTGMMGEVVGMAAALAVNNKTTPRGVYQNHLDDLDKLMKAGVKKYDVENKQNYNLGGTLGSKEVIIPERKNIPKFPNNENK